MLVFYGYYRIPEWSLCYLINGDREGLNDEEIESVDEFINEITESAKCYGVHFCTAVMNEDKYSNYYRDELNPYPDFGSEFGACTTYDLPCYIDVDDGPQERFDILITGRSYLKDSYEVHVFKNKPFVDETEATLWAEFYFKYLDRERDVIVKEAGKIECDIVE